MRGASAALPLVLVGLLAACGGGGSKNSEPAKPQSVQIQLQEESASGEVGTATLSSDGAKTKVVIDLVSHAANDQPAHIHRGTCTNLDATPAYPLNDVVEGRSTTVVAASLDSLLAKDYAINVHRSAKKLNEYVVCGNIDRSSAPAPTITNNDEGGDY